MSVKNDFRKRKTYEKLAAKEKTWSGKISKENWEMMIQAAKFFLRELTQDLNFEFFPLKYGAYSFTMDELSCKTFRIIFNNGFEDGLKRYLVDIQDFHYALIINKKLYPGRDGYGLHQGSNNEVTAKKLQRKLITTVEKEKLKELRGDIHVLNGMITHKDNITALRVFNVEILRQISAGNSGLKRHFLTGMLIMRIGNQMQN